MSAHHGLSKAAERWSLTERERLLKALRQFRGRFSSEAACAAALGVGKTGVSRALSTDITIGMAEKLATALGTTADDIAKGRWTAEGRAA